MTPAGLPSRAASPIPRRTGSRTIRFAVRLFPARWRERYGDEFAALLEATPSTPRILLDVLVAAVDAHLDPTGPRRRWPLITDRIRSSELSILAAWVLFVLAGLAFQRMTDGAPFGPIAAADAAIGLPVLVLIGAAVVSLAAVVVAGVPIAAAIAVTAARTGRPSLLWLLAVPPVSLAAWLGVTLLLAAVGGPSTDGTSRILLFLAWAGLFVAAAVASTVAVRAAALRADVDGTLYARAARPAAVTALAIAVGTAAVGAWGIALLATRPDEFWGFEGLVSASTALTWLAIVVAMAVAAAVALRAARSALAPPAP